MAIQKIFAYNTGSLISGTTQVGNIAISEADVEYSANFGGLQWWGGPDETNGYVIAHTDPSGSHDGAAGGSANLGFWRSTGLTDSDFLILCNSIPPRIGDTPFTNTSEASTWLDTNGYWTSFITLTPTPTSTLSVTPTPTPTGVGQLINPILVGLDEYLEVGTDEYLMFVDPAGPTPTPSVTPTNTETPTPTPSITPSPTETTLPPTPTTTETPTPTVTNTQTPSVTPTFTPTPSTSPIPVTGYGYNLVALPYNFPTSGNSIMNASSGQTGTTLINELTITNRGFYFNSLDNIGVDRTSYYSQFTGQSVTITFTQNGDSAIYSGDSQSFKFWSGNTGDPGSPIPGTGFVFGTEINIPPTTGGTVVLIQSASTTWVTGATVYVSVVNNNPSVTPTPTATSVTPTPTPTSGATTDGWLFYSPDNEPVLTAPINNGNTTFIYNGSSNGTYSPNYTGGTFNLYFNTGTTLGTSYLSQFSTLNDSGGTITISQGSSTAIYSGNSLNYQINSGFLVLSVSNSVQMIQSASTRFVSGTTINVVVN